MSNGFGMEPRRLKRKGKKLVPSLPSKESKAEWHSSQNLSVTLLQRVSLGKDWAFVKTHKAVHYPETGFSISIEASRVNAVTALA